MARAVTSLTALRLTDPVTSHLADLARLLDAAYLGLAKGLGPGGDRDTDQPVKLEPDRDGKTRLHLAPQEVPEPPPLLTLRESVARMMPRVDLPGEPLEVDAWTGYLSELTHAGLSAVAAGTLSLIRAHQIPHRWRVGAAPAAAGDGGLGDSLIPATDRTLALER